MDIKTFLSGIKSLTDFQRISQLPCFSSNVNFKGIIPILMQNFLCFDFKDNLLSKKIPQISIKLFKIILTNLDDLEIEQNNVEMLQLFKYILKQADKFITLPYPNVGRILFWGVMEEIIPIISKTVSRSPSLRQAAVLHLQDRFLGMILSSPPFSVAQISFLVGHLNACIQSLPSPPKIEPYQSSKLGALMCSCGDYPLQVMLLELYNFLGKTPVLPPGRAYSHLQANITKDNFHQDCRSFLNKINSLELQVVSFQCSELAIGSVVIRGPLWVDWNHGSFRVSWACDGAALGLSPNNLEHFSLRLEEVHHINYRRQQLTLDGARVSAGSPEACALFENMPPCLVLTFLEKQGPRLVKILKLLNDRMPPLIKLDQDDQCQYIFQFPAASEASDIPFSANRPSSSQGPHSPPSILSKLMKDLHIPNCDIKYRWRVSAIQENSMMETDLSVENLLRDLDMIPATPPALPAPPAPGFQRCKVSKTGRLEIPMAQHKVSFVCTKIHAASRFPPEAHAVDSDENNAVTSPVLKKKEIPMAQRKVSFVSMKIHIASRFPPEAHAVDSDEKNAVTSPIPVLKKKRDRPTNTKLVDSTLSMIGMKDLHKADKILNDLFQDVSGELKKIDNIKENEEYSIRNKLSLNNKIPDLPTTMKFSRTTKLLFNANVPESTSPVKQTPLELGKSVDDLPQENDVQSIPIPLNNLEKENVQFTSKKPINLIKVRSIKSSGDMKQIFHSDLSQDSSMMNNLESHPVDIEKKVHTAESSSRESSKRKKLDIQSSSSHCATRSTKHKKKINLRLKAKLKSKVEVEPKLFKMNPVIGNDKVAIEIDLADRDISPLDKDRAAQELCKMYGPKPRWSVLDKSFPQDILMEDDLKNVKEVEFEVPPSLPKTAVSNLVSLSRGVLDAETIRRINSSGSESDIYIPASPRKAPPPANMATTPAVSGNKIDDLSVEKVSNEGVTDSRKRNIKQVKTSKQNQNYAAKKASKRFKNSSPNQKQDYSVRNDLIKDSHFQSPEIVLLPNEANVTERRKLYSAKYDDPDLLMYQCPSEEEIPSPLMQEDKTKGAAVSGTSRGSQTHSTASFSYRHNKDQPTPRDIRISETFNSLKAMAPTYSHEAEPLHFQYTFADYDESVHKSTTASKKQKKGIAGAKKDSKKYMKLPITRKPNKELTNVITGEISGKTLNMVRNNITLIDKVVRCNPCDNAHLVKDDVPYKDICIDLSEDDVPLAKLSQFEMMHPDRPPDIPKITKQTCSGLINLAIQKNKKITKSNKKITDSKSSVHLVPPTLDTSLPSLTVENLPILKYNNSFDGDNIMEWIVNKGPLLDITSTPPLEFDKEETEMRHLLQSSALIGDCIDLTLEDEPEMSGQHHISYGPADNLVLHSSQSTNSCQTDSRLYSEDTVIITIDEEPILQTEKEPKKIPQQLPIFDFDLTKYVKEVSPASSPNLIYCGSETDLLDHEGVCWKDKPKVFEKSQGVSKGINIEALKQGQMSSTESTGTSSKSSLNPLSTKKYGTAVAKTLPCPSNRDDLQPSENENSVNNVSQKQMPQCTVNMMKNNLCVIRETLMPSLESTGTSSKSPLNPVLTKRMEDRIEEVAASVAQWKTSFKMGWDNIKKVVDELLNDQ